MNAPHRVDVHQHVVPPFWIEALPSHGGDPSGARAGDASSPVIPQWSSESAIAFMDSQEIATSILSLTSPGIVRWQEGERREMARRVNDYTADLVAKRPDRFGNFATVPLPDVDGALSEFEYALDTLRADGVILLGNYAEKYLGDASFEPRGPYFRVSPHSHTQQSHDQYYENKRSHTRALHRGWGVV